MFCHVKFNHLSLEKSHLFRCDFHQTDFSYSNFAGANLKALYVYRSNFSFVRFLKTHFGNVNFESAYIDESNFANSDFTESCFLGTSFTKGRVKNSVFDNLILRDIDVSFVTAKYMCFENNLVINNLYDAAKLNSIDTTGSVGLPLVAYELKKQELSLFDETIQYWPKINIITGENFSGTIESFKDHFVSNEEDEIKKKKYELTLSYIKAMAELDGFD